LIAVVTGGLGSTAVSWTVSPNVGSVSSGLYTAPATITTQLIVTVTATSIVDTSKSAKSTITITQPGPAVTLNSVSCTPSVIFAPGTAACSVALSGPAPSGGFVVRLAADSANVTVPGSVTVLPGNISAGFATVVAFSMVGQTSIMASANGVSQMFSLSVSSRALVSVGIFRQGFFWLFDMNGDRQFDVPPDKGFAFGGLPGDMPITGDWNGSGSSKAGIFRASSGVFVLDYNGDGLYTSADKTYNFGVGAQPGDVPVVGDWSGDGLTKIGLFRQGYFWILDTNGNGIFEQGVDQSTAFGGVTGDVPVVGDWNGSGRSKLGLVRMGFFWILDHNGDGSLDNVNLGGGDKAFAFGGISGDVPVVGDWNGDGRAKPGVFRGGFFWVLDVNGNYQFDGTGVGQDLAFSFGGIADDKPIVGRWGG